MKKSSRIASLLCCASAVCSAGQPGSIRPSTLDEARSTAFDLLARVCEAFECAYSDVVVADASFADDVNYIVRFTCEGSRCPEALSRLVERSAGTDLSFSLRPPPVDVESDSFDPLDTLDPPLYPPMDPGSRDLIHEIDPDPGQ